MEMCKYEHHEMLCRPGCKCEQQYRMHRLLAFDPSNECRGIFSDWFELPSFCVCKCYESITENFIPRPRKPRKDLEMDAKESLSNSENGKASDTRSSPDVNDTPNKLEKISDGRSFQNIPAILPYEARVALLKEFRHRDNRNLLKSLEDINVVQDSDSTQTADDKLSEKATQENNNKKHKDLESENIIENQDILSNSKDDNEDESHNQDEKYQGTFLYRLKYENLPVMEFRLPDGSSGTVDKVPR